jgi:hypothetical protein
LCSFQLSVDPVTFSLTAINADPFTFTVPESHVEEAPVNTLGTDVSTPTMIEVVFELSLIDEVLTLSTNTLEPSVPINLPHSTLGVILTDSQVVVDWTMVRSVSHDIFGMENTELLPLFKTKGKCFSIVQSGNLTGEILWFRLEFIDQFLGEIWFGLHSSLVGC